jgi:hypothetical protein
MDRPLYRVRTLIPMLLTLLPACGSSAGASLLGTVGQAVGTGAAALVG